MNRKCFGIVALIAAAALLFSLPSCGHSQQLVSIDVEPTDETFGAANIPVSDDAGLTAQLRALGSYIHPPVTKDITAQATWTSNDSQLVTVDSTGLLTATGLACGSSLISATVTTNHSSGGISSSGAIVTGFMTANVTCFTGGAAPGITLDFRGSGSGIVTSAPLGLSCASRSGKCSGRLTNGSPLTLTAAPNRKFGGWEGCDSVSESGLVCTINSRTSDSAVTATFN